MKLLVVFASLVATMMAQELKLFEPPKTHSEIMHLIENHYHSSYNPSNNFLNLLGKRNAEKRSFFSKIGDGLKSIGHFFKDHEGDLLKTAENLLPLIPTLVGKRAVETDEEDFFSGIKNAAHSVGHYLHEHPGEVVSTVISTAIPIAVDALGKRDVTLEEADFLGGIKNAIHKTGDFFKAHTGDIIKLAETGIPIAVKLLGKREAELDEADFLGGIKDAFHKTGDFLKSHTGDIIKIAETGLPIAVSLLGKRQAELEEADFLGGIKDAFHKTGDFFKAHTGDIIKLAETGLPIAIKLLGKREADMNEEDFFGSIKDAFHSAGSYAKEHKQELISSAVSSTISTVVPIAVKALGKRSTQDPMPEFITKLQQLLKKETELLHNIQPDQTFHGMLDRLNYLEKFTHTTNSHAIVRRGFFDNILSGLKHSAEYVSSHLGEIATTAVTTLLPTAVSLLGKRDISEVPQRFGKLIEEGAKQFFAKISSAYEGAMKLAHNLLSNLKEGAKTMLNGGNIKEVAQNVINTITTDMHNMLKNNIFEVDVEKFVEDLVPQAAKTLTHVNKRFLITGLVDGIKDSIGDVVGMLSNGFGDLNHFFSGIVQTATNALAPSLTNVKALATTFLSHAGQVTANVAAEAIKFFKPFASALGPLWTKINSLVGPLLQVTQ